MSAGMCRECGDYSTRLYGSRLDTCLDCWSPAPSKAKVRPEPADDVGAPTLEQCENVALVLGFGSLTLFKRLPHYEQSLRNLHALVAKAALGDPDANRTLAHFREAFSTDRSQATPVTEPQEGPVT